MSAKYKETLGDTQIGQKLPFGSLAIRVHYLRDLPFTRQRYSLAFQILTLDIRTCRQALANLGIFSAAVTLLSGACFGYVYPSQLAPSETIDMALRPSLQLQALFIQHLS
jgi:hypothetical protein